MNQNKANKNIALPVLGGVLAVAVIVMIVALCIPKAPEKGTFVPPSFDSHAAQGVPEMAEDEKETLVYREVYQDGMAYRLSVCWVPAVDGRELTVYFTNDKGNESNLKLRVYDESGSVIWGETGLIKPGEYVKAVTLDQELTPGTKVRLKVMGYEPETYESTGWIKLNFTVQ